MRNTYSGHEGAVRRLSPRRDLGAVPSQCQRLLYHLRRGLQVRLDSGLLTCYLNFSFCILICFCVVEIFDCLYALFSFASYHDHFNVRLVTGGPTGEVYARTGYLGFLRRTEAIGSDGGKRSPLPPEFTSPNERKSLHYCCRLALSKMASSYHSTAAASFIVRWRHRHLPLQD